MTPSPSNLSNRRVHTGVFQPDISIAQCGLHTVKPMKYIILVIRQLYHEDNEALLDNICQFMIEQHYCT
ncbi:hypothetical protein L873DRAFT_1806101 [Choiromyces venosus 120613-1]|uniref:Uncharacterized protein n=1 Tax=Choiromyces venosus 120613-1 TaxID=1336337 RepID=A0A3N4JNU4_9PEZI|nr:hypothetical protein L873DRAFT_1806101 [Choiromyces venosus 120613-1]